MTSGLLEFFPKKPERSLVGRELTLCMHGRPPSVDSGSHGSCSQAACKDPGHLAQAILLSVFSSVERGVRI